MAVSTRSASEVEVKCDGTPVTSTSATTPTRVPTVDDTGDVEYTTVNIGAGFVDAVGAVERAANDDLVDSWKKYERELTLAGDA